MTVLVGKRKNDQHRDGHKIDIVESGKVSCPVSITRKLIGLLGDEKTSEFPSVRRIVIKREDKCFIHTHSIKSGAESNIGKWRSH